MADLFDVSVGGVGWHFTSHLIALAALFIACFAIAGYITFRDNSIPAKAVKDGEGFEDEDITANSLTLSGNATIGGELTLSGLSAATNLAGAFGPLDGVAGQSVGSMGADIPRLKSIRQFFATKTSLTAAESSLIFGNTGGVASVSATLDAAALAARAPAALTPLFYTGDLTAAVDMSTNNRPLNLTTGQQLLIIFGGNSLNFAAGAAAITLAVHANDGFDDSAICLLTQTTTANIYANGASGAGADTDEDLVITHTANGTRILPGSFIYMEATGAATVALKGFIETTGGQVTVNTAA